MTQYTFCKLNTITMHAACVTIKLTFYFYYKSIDRDTTGSGVGDSSKVKFLVQL